MNREELNAKLEKLGRVMIKDLIREGLVSEGDSLCADINGKEYEAKIKGDGSLEYNGTLYDSLGKLSKAVVNHECCGWDLWLHKSKSSGELKKMTDVRKGYREKIVASIHAMVA